MRFLLCVDQTNVKAVHEVALHLKSLLKETDEVISLSAFVPPERIIDSVDDGGMIAAVPEDVWRKRNEAAEKAVAAVLTEVQKVLPQATGRVMHCADPRDAILNASKDLGIDIIVLGTREMGAIKSFFLGSVSQYILHNFKGVARGVMIVHQHNLEASHHYGVAIDGSETSMKAVATAAQLYRPGDRITLYTAYNPPSTTQYVMLGSGEPMFESNPHYEAELAMVRKKVDANLASARELLFQQGVDQNRVNLFGEQVPDIKKALVEFTTKNEIHTIIMGTRGLGALSRLLLGSVSTYVSTHATNATVLVIS